VKPAPPRQTAEPGKKAAAERLGPDRFTYEFVRLWMKTMVRCYVHVRISGLEHLPAEGPLLICFNHPSWLDPIVLVGCWPDRKRRLFVFGPRENDMTDSLRNRAIARTGRGVPLKPDGADALDVTRRAVAVLRGGDALVVAGEGHLSDHEGELMPLETGVAHFAMLAKVPVVPLAIVGTGWVHFGSTVRLTFGAPVDYRGHGSGREGARVMTAELQTALQSLLAGVTDQPRPGRFGAFLSELFNDRSWKNSVKPEDAVKPESEDDPHA
jgi:1-acyl-sn-glycerol-3-phosphate acyltransferase